MQDIEKVINLLKNNKVIAMVAPSFVIDFNYKTFADKLRTIGFDKVTELTFGAREVNLFYRDYLKKHPKDLWISTTCPAVVDIVLKKFPHLIDNLIPGVSPMVAMSKIIHKEYPKHKIVFIGPCMYKKKEADKFSDVDVALTYKEIPALFKLCKANNLCKKVDKKSYYFDQFYDDATKVYPISGGLAKSMHIKEVLKPEEVIVCDGSCAIKMLEKFNEHPGKVKFLDILFCKGGCVGGPGVITKMPTLFRKKKVWNYMKFAKKHKTGEKVGLDKYLKGIDFKIKKFKIL